MKTLKWTDVFEIARDLEDANPNVDVINISFTQLWQSVIKLPRFQDDPKRSNERILEAIQQAWLDERD